MSPRDKVRACVWARRALTRNVVAHYVSSPPLGQAPWYGVRGGP